MMDDRDYSRVPHEFGGFISDLPRDNRRSTVQLLAGGSMDGGFLSSFDADSFPSGMSWLGKGRWESGREELSQSSSDDSQDWSCLPQEFGGMKKNAPLSAAQKYHMQRPFLSRGAYDWSPPPPRNRRVNFSSNALIEGSAPSAGRLSLHKTDQLLKDIQPPAKRRKEAPKKKMKKVKKVKKVVKAKKRKVPAKKARK